MDVETRRRFERFYPFRLVDWPWQAARQIVADRRHVSRRRDEPAIVEAVGFLRARDRCRGRRAQESLRRRWPTLVAAHEPSLDDGLLTWEVQARILAGQSDREIAARCAVTPEAVSWYETMFYRVRDRLAARGWICMRAIGPRESCGLAEGDLGPLWRAYGFHGGPDVLDVVMAVSLDRDLPAWVGASAGAARADVEEQLRLQCRLAIAADQIPRDVAPLRLLAL